MTKEKMLCYMWASKMAHQLWKAVQDMETCRVGGSFGWQIAYETARNTSELMRRFHAAAIVAERDKWLRKLWRDYFQNIRSQIQATVGRMSSNDNTLWD